MQRRRWLVWALPGAVALLPAACGDDPASGVAADAGGDASASVRQVFVGEVEGSDARVGAVFDGRAMRLFVCGGAASYATLTRWFTLEAVSPGEPFDAEKGDLHALGTLTADALSGELERSDGTRLAFHALRASDGLSGLYDADGSCGKLGLIVSEDASGAQGQGACIGADGLIQQINPVLPIALASEGGVLVEVAGETVPVVPAQLP